MVKMIRRTVVGLFVLMPMAACAHGPAEDIIEVPGVVLNTDAGEITVALDLDHAPITTCNFLSYVATGDYDGGSFFRTVVKATNTGNPNPIDVIQAATPRGSDDAARPPIPLERTRDTGMRHWAGTISMARDGPDSATSSFFIVTEDSFSLDFGGARNPDGQGFAAFGQVVEGMDVVHRIQMSPSNGEEQLTPPVMIRSARIVSGDLKRWCP